MKKLILLLTICILTSCNWNTSTPLIITGIKIDNNFNTHKIYKLTVNNKISVFSTKKYNIGDTLK